MSIFGIIIFFLICILLLVEFGFVFYRFLLIKIFRSNQIKDQAYVDDLYKFFIYSKFNTSPILNFNKEFNRFRRFYNSKKNSLLLKNDINNVQNQTEITQMISLLNKDSKPVGDFSGTMTLNFYPHLQPNPRKIINYKTEKEEQDLEKQANTTKTKEKKVKNSSKASKTKDSKSKVKSQDNTYFDDSKLDKINTKAEARAEEEERKQRDDIKKLMSDL